MNRTLTLLSSVVSFVFAATAWAGPCDSALVSARAAGERSARISADDRASLVSACGADGVALLVEHWTTTGRCDLAAQLGRSWIADPGVEAAVAAAESCLTAQVLGTVRDMDDLAEGKSRRAPRGAPPADAAVGFEAPAAQPQAEKADRANSGVAAGGGGGAGLGSSRSRGEADAWGDAPRRPSSTAAPSPVLASTGMGASVASPRVYGRLSFTILFDHGSANLRPESFATLGAVAAALATLGSGTEIEIVGHTDDTGSWSYNLGLSETRAGSVTAALQLLGVRRPLARRGLGEAEPVADNDLAEGRARNRRVEFRFRRDVAIVTR